LWRLRHPLSPLVPYTSLFRSGDENAYIFGAKNEELPGLRENYNPGELYSSVPGLARVLDALVDGTLGSEQALALSYKARPGCSRSEEHTSELQSRFDLVFRLL